MGTVKFGACEYNFPVWGSLALEMAHEAGFDGIEITDGGGYLQPHPMNKGLFVEYERLALNLVRLDGFPLTDRIVQEDYLEARDRTGIQITGVYLYFLNSRLRIPLVSVPTKGMFGVAKNAYALEKLEYAVRVGGEYGVRIANSFDTSLARELEVLDRLGGKLKADFNTIDPVGYAQGDPAEMIRALGRERIEQLKIKDLKADREGFLTRETGEDAALGRGDAPWRDCVRAARDIGFEGWVLSDTPFNSAALREDGGDYVSLAKRDAAVLREAFGG